MRPQPGVEHVLRFVDVDESAFVGGGLDPLATDVGLWVVGDGRPRHPGDAEAGVEPNRDVARPGAAGDELVVAPVEAGDFTPRPSRWATPSRRSGSAGPRCSTSAGTPGSRGRRAAARTSSSGPSSPSRSGTRQLRHLGPRQPGGTTTVGVLGRYGLHFHHAHDGSRGSVVEGVVVRDCGDHAFVPAHVARHHDPRLRRVRGLRRGVLVGPGRGDGRPGDRPVRGRVRPLRPGGRRLPARRVRARAWDGDSSSAAASRSPSTAAGTPRLHLAGGALGSVDVRGQPRAQQRLRGDLRVAERPRAAPHPAIHRLPQRRPPASSTAPTSNSYHFRDLDLRDQSIAIDLVAAGRADFGGRPQSWTDVRGGAILVEPHNLPGEVARAVPRLLVPRRRDDRRRAGRRRRRSTSSSAGSSRSTSAWPR